MTEIFEGWKGTLYAKWKEIISSVADVPLSSDIHVYDPLGRYLGTELPTNEHGVFIVVQGKEKYKIVL